MTTNKWTFTTVLTLHFLHNIAYSSGTFYDDDYYYGSGEIPTLHEDLGPSPPFADFCRDDGDCKHIFKRYCCQETKRCCYTRNIGGVYMGAKTTCTNSFKQYTGVECPQKAFSKIYCCYEGYRCCSATDIMKITSYNKPERDTIDKSGVTSMGAIAGFVFLAVIVAGTLLTLATRYIKIKVRREHARAGIQSQAYIDAINRRVNNRGRNTNNNNNPPPITNEHQQNQHPNPDIFYITPIPEESQEEEDEETGPPPTYEEAVSTCPVIPEESARQEQARTPEMVRQPARNFRFRPPSRPSRLDVIELSTIKNNMNMISEEDLTPETMPSITFPKQDTSEA